MLTVIFPNSPPNTPFSGRLIVDIGYNSTFASYFPQGRNLQLVQTLAVELSTIPVYTATTNNIQTSQAGVTLST